MLKENKAQKDFKTICPKCHSDNVVPYGRWKGDCSMLCNNCGYRGYTFLKKEKIKNDAKTKNAKERFKNSRRL